MLVTGVSFARPLHRILQSDGTYDHHERTHRALKMKVPVPCLMQPPMRGPARKGPEVSRLHHHDERIAA